MKAGTIHIHHRSLVCSNVKGIKRSEKSGDDGGYYNLKLVGEKNHKRKDSYRFIYIKKLNNIPKKRKRTTN